MDAKGRAIRDALLQRYGGATETRGWRHIDCPACGTKAKDKKCAVHVDQGAVKCFVCGPPTPHNNAYELVKDIVKFDAPAREEFSPLEKAIWRYRKATGKTWRLSDSVVERFGIRYDKAGAYFSPVWPAPDGSAARYLATGKRNGWNAIAGAPRALLGSDKISPSGLLIFCEGEWDLAAIWEHWGLAGVYATGGAQGITPYTDTTGLFAPLKSGHDVVIFYDDDQAGRVGAHNLAANIYTRHKVASIRIVDWAPLRRVVPGVERAKAGADLEDAIRAGLTIDQFRALVEAVPPFTLTAPVAIDSPARDIIRPSEPPPPLPVELSRLAPIAGELWALRHLPQWERRRAIKAIWLANQDLIADIIGTDNPNFDGEIAWDWMDGVLMGELHGAAVEYFAAEAVRRDSIRRERGRGRMGANIIWKHNGIHYEQADDSDVAAATEGILRTVGGYAAGANAKASTRRHVRAELTAAITLAPEASILNRLDRQYLNLSDGVLDMRTLELLPHGPEYLFAAVNQDLAWSQHVHGCPAVHKFLESALEGEQTREFWKFLYTTIAEYPRIQKAAFFIGQGGTGKGTAAMLFKTIIGEPWTSALTVDDLDDDFKAYTLVGKVLNIWEEIGKGGHINSEKFKKITGLSPMTANGKFRDPFTFTPEAQWLIVVNETPNASDYSKSFLRRMVLFDFGLFNPAEVSSSYFEDVLKPQAAGALHYALTKGREWFAADSRQFLSTAASRETIRLIEDADAVASFWRAKIESAAGATFPPVASNGEPAAPWVAWWRAGRPGHGFQSVYTMDATKDYVEFIERVDEENQKRVSKANFLSRSKDFWTTFLGDNVFRGGEGWIKFDVKPDVVKDSANKAVRGLRLGYRSQNNLVDASVNLARPDTDLEPF